MRYLGIDYGTKRIGITISREDIAFPRGVIPNDSALLETLKDLISQEHVEHVIVGDARTFAGGENPVTKDVETFMERLHKETGLLVTASAEAGSSVEASRHAPEEEKRDDAAAAFILQRFLDMRGDTT